MRGVEKYCHDVGDCLMSLLHRGYVVETWQEAGGNYHCRVSEQRSKLIPLSYCIHPTMLGALITSIQNLR